MNWLIPSRRANAVIEWVLGILLIGAVVWLTS